MIGALSAPVSRQLDEDAGPLRAGEGDAVEKVGDVSLKGNVEWAHQQPLVDEEEELFKSVKEWPLGQEADALVGHYPPLVLHLVVVESEQGPLLLGEQILVVLLVEADGAAVHLARGTKGQHERRLVDVRVGGPLPPALDVGAKWEAEHGRSVVQREVWVVAQWISGGEKQGINFNPCKTPL